MDAKEYYEKVRRHSLKIWEEREVLTMPKDFMLKVKGFYRREGRQKLEKFKGEIVKKYDEPLILKWDDKKGLVFIISPPDSGADFDIDDNQFVWANISSEKFKEPILKVIMEYKRLLDKI